VTPTAPRIDPALIARLVPENEGRDAWYENVPRFACSDESVTALYYYRCWLMRRHIVEHADIGMSLISEFDSKEQLYWAGARNSIVGASDHHVNEARWIKGQRAARDHLTFLLTDSGAQPRNYASALAASALAIAHVSGDTAFPTSLLDALVANHRGWLAGRVEYPHDNGFDRARNLYWNAGRNSSGEYNLASAQLNEPLRGIQGYKIRGGAGFRPDINADMFADVSAIAEIARLAGRGDIAGEFAGHAARLQASANRELWDERRGFYMHRWLREEYADGDSFGAPSIKAGSFIWDTNARTTRLGHQPEADGRGKGRELVGLMPWYRGMAPDDATRASAWNALIDPDCFEAPYGPTTAQQTDPWYSVQFDCRANGNSFPLVTSRVLNGLANLLNDYSEHGSMTPDVYRRLFACYIRTQTRNGIPYVAEFHHPDEDVWVVDRPIGQHYFHSSFIDLMITGMLGLRPGPDDVLKINPLTGTQWSYFAIEGICYHGHRIDMAFDRTGDKLGWQGFAVFVDGALRWQADTPQPTSLDLKA
jgi:hypothetical protein